MDKKFNEGAAMPSVLYHPDGSGRLRGESPKAFAKRQRLEAEDAALWRQEEKERQQREKQESCAHYHCEPTEWHWSGAVREMTCRDCGLRDYREEPGNAE